jgi:DNA-binding CsgD family transcriptional regulator
MAKRMARNGIGRSPLVGAAGRRPSRQDATQAPAGVELLQFVHTLAGATSRWQLSQRFSEGFGRLFGLPMYALYVVDPWTGGQQRVASVGVSDTFLARYEREGREVDVLQTHVKTTGAAAYNLTLTGSMDAWLEHPLYTRVKYLHDIRHEIQSPVINRTGFVGTLHAGTSDRTRGFTPYEVKLTEALTRAVGTVIERITATEELERERDLAVAALDHAGTAIVVTDSATSEPSLNDAARMLLQQVVDAEYALHRVIARAGTLEGFSRHIDIEFVGGGTGLLYGQSAYTHAGGGALITVLELQRDESEISPETLMALTPREREVALLVVEGHSDREIADRLFLSPYTVSQYVKRIYRKLEVPSRVALTRLLLEIRNSRER